MEMSVAASIAKVHQPRAQENQTKIVGTLVGFATETARVVLGIAPACIKAMPNVTCAEYVMETIQLAMIVRAYPTGPILATIVEHATTTLEMTVQSQLKEQQPHRQRRLSPTALANSEVLPTKTSVGGVTMMC
jgi:hypothetical protein